MTTPAGRDPGAAAGGPGLTLTSTAGRWALFATILGGSMAILDGTVINVALPRIGEQLGAGLTGLQWTVNAYTLTLSGLLLLGGSLGDRMGRRRIFVIGVIWFAVASAGCAAAPSATFLIAMRAFQGIGAALLTPGSLAILEASFRKEDRAAAIGSWAGLTGIAAAIGPLLGGALVGIAPWGWRLVFLINLPLAAAVVWTTVRHVPETRDEQAAGKLDIPGAVLAALGLAGLTYGLTEGPNQGWTIALIISVVLGVALLIGFVLNEAKRPNPLMPLELFRSRQFSGTNGVTFAVYGALSGAFFLLPVMLQQVPKLSPLEAGSALLPVPIVMLVLSPVMGKVATRIGPRIPMTIGPLVCAGALVLFGSLGLDSTLVDALWRVTIFALGLSITVAPLTATALASAPNRQAGVASAINNAVARTAGLLVVAVLPALAGMTTAVYDNPVELDAAFGTAVLIAAVLCAGGGVLAWFTIRNDVLSPDAA